MKNKFTLLFIFFLCSTWSFAQNCTTGTTVGSAPCDFLTDGTLTIGANVTMITVEAWGAGGGSTSGANNNRAGGGGGAYFTTTYSVTAGATFSITVGQGVTNQDGEATSFNIGGAITVGGGTRGGNQPGPGGTAPAGGVDGGDGGGRGGQDTGGGGGGSGLNPMAGAGGGAGGLGGTGGGGTGGGGTGGNGGAINVGGSDGGFPGGGAGGKGDNTDAANTYSSTGGNGRVIVTVAAVLPVELVRFNANTKDNQILLEWQTASEINNEGFEIQKSKDGISWEILEFVEGNGTSFVSNTYTFMDRFPTQGSNFYRLKQMDFDGNFEYSKTVSVDFNNQRDEVGIFPNPVQNQLTLINGEGEAIIYNTLGKAVKHLIIDTDEATTIQLGDLLNGIYYLQVHQDRTIVTKQFSKIN